MRRIFIILLFILIQVGSTPAGADQDPKILGYLRIDNLAPSEVSERTICSVVAALEYEVPANIILAVAEIENGKQGGKVLNTNGTYDIGVMQFNSAYLATLSRYGITSKDVAACGCYPYELAAWRIKNHIEGDRGDIWQRAANYHSKTPLYNSIYRRKLIRAAAKWAVWLEQRFQTCEIALHQ